MKGDFMSTFMTPDRIRIVQGGIRLIGAAVMLTTGQRWGVQGLKDLRIIK